MFLSPTSARGHWAGVSARYGLVDFDAIERSVYTGDYKTPVSQPWSETPLSDKLDELRRQCARLKIDDRIIDWEAGLWFSHTETLFVTVDGGFKEIIDRKAAQNLFFGRAPPQPEGTSEP